MAKRVGNLYDKMLNAEQMDKVYKGVMKGKHRKDDPTSISFMIKNNKDYYLTEVCRMLEYREFKPHKPRHSIRRDKGSGKLREIQAPVLWPDQFVHWAMMLQLQPIFAKGMDHWCCASVKDRGTLYAKNFIEKLLDDSDDENKAPKDRVRNKYKYALKLDIRKYFAHVDREILMAKIRAKVKDEEMIELCRKIIYSVPGQGIPLGYYTSQWFANFYLQDFDHYLREVIMPRHGVKIYLRFMDDMFLAGSNKRKLERVRAEIEQYLATLKLELKPGSLINLHEEPLVFIGYQFSYGKTTLRENIVDNMVKANRKLYKGKFTIKKLESFNSYNGWVQSSDTHELSEKILIGSRKIERMKLIELLSKRKTELVANGTFDKIAEIEQRIAELRAAEQGPNDKVLIRYYSNRDEARIVARTNYKMPGEDEYKAKLAAQAKKEAEEREKRKATKKKRKRKHRPGRPYYPSAMIAFDDGDKGRAEVIRSYNDEINFNNEVAKNQALEYQMS